MGCAVPVGPSSVRFGAAPLVRLLSPAFRQLLRNRGTQLRVLPMEASTQAVEGCLNSVMHATSEGLDARDPGSALRELVSGLPVSVVTALCSAPRWAEGGGQDVAEPLGVLSEIALAVVTRASWVGRPKRLKSICEEQMARLLSGLHPLPPHTKAPSEPRRSNLEPVVNQALYGQTYGNSPAQPDGESRAWGADSSAQLPLRGGEFSPDAAQQIGYCMARLKAVDTALNSGMRVAVVDRGAVETAPGASPKDVAEYTRPDGVSARGPRVLKTAATLRKVFRWQFGEFGEIGPRGMCRGMGHALCRAGLFGNVVRARFASFRPRPGPCVDLRSSLPGVAGGSRVVTALYLFGRRRRRVECGAVPFAGGLRGVP